MPENPSEKTVVLVAGMHRSGTSVLTRLLVSLGCDAPRTLMHADDHNARGYWESQKIADLNDAILESAGSAWDDWERFNPDWFASPRAADFRDRAVELLASEYGDSRLLVLKDPRICRLLPFWSDVVAAFGATARIAIPLRNPLEVAESLATRDAIPTSIGTLLWLRNVVDAEADSRALPRAFTRYEDILSDWRAVAAQLGRDLKIAWPRQSTRAAVELKEDVAPELRHQRHDDATTHLVAEWTKTVCGVFDRWTRNQTRDEDIATLDAVRNALDDSAAVFGEPIAIGARLGKSNRALQQAAKERDDLIAAREGEVATLKQGMERRDQEIASLARLTEAKDQQISALDKAVAERDVRTDRLIHAAAERDQRIAELQRGVADRDQRIAERDQRIAELQRGVADRDQHIAERDQHASELERVGAERDSELRTVKRALADHDATIAAFRRSTSWRLTRPLRWASATFSGATPAPEAASGPATTPSQSARAGDRRGPPLGARLRRRLHRRLSRQPSRQYVACERGYLADRNHEAKRNDGPLPILFDADYYLAHNDDVREGAMDPLTHYMEHGALEGRLPIDIASDTLDPLVRDLHRFDLARPDATAFDANFYRALYPDLAELDADALLRHYTEYGKEESRMGSMGEFLRDICDSPREIPIDFRAKEYLGLYPELQTGFADRPDLEALRHYMQFGRWEPRLHTLRMDRSAAKTAASAPREDTDVARAAAPPLCVLAHVYYPELWSELSGYLANLPKDSYHLYVNLVDTTFTQEALTSVREAFPEARVYISKNVGRDIGGHMQMLRNLHMGDYRFFLLVHTKKSPHISLGEAQWWRHQLLLPLLGNEQIVRENLRLLEDETVGQIGAESRRKLEINDNAEKYNTLLDALGVRSEAREVDFLSGTMMFLRREILQRVFEAAESIDFESGDEQSLAFHMDGQWAHAVERAFGAVARDMNYRLVWLAPA